MNYLVDVGWNAANSVFDSDRQDVWVAAQQAGIRQAVLTGTSFEQSCKVQQLAQQQPGWFFTAGTHPHAAKHHRESNDWFSVWSDDRCVAIGECGLDYFRMLSTRNEQLTAFKQQLNVALSLSKPVFLHVRDAHNDAVSLLKEFTNAGGRGIVHCFTGTATEGQRYVDLGLSLGCTGWIFDDRRNTGLLSAVKAIPIAHWLLETDAPYLTPRTKPRLSSRNVPENLKHVADRLAHIWCIPYSDVVLKTTLNAQRLFGLPSAQG